MTKEDSRRASTADQSPFTTKNPVGTDRRCAGGTQKRIVAKGNHRLAALLRKDSGWSQVRPLLQGCPVQMIDNGAWSIETTSAIHNLCSIIYTPLMTSYDRRSLQAKPMLRDGGLTTAAALTPYPLPAHPFQIMDNGKWIIDFAG